MSDTTDGALRPPASTDGDLRSRLLGIKLRALVGDHLGGPVDAESRGFPRGAALSHDGSAWVLVDGLETEALSGKADLSSSGRYLATPHTDEHVRVWDLETGSCIAEWNVGTTLTAVWFFPDEWRVLGTTVDGQLLQISADETVIDRVRVPTDEAPVVEGAPEPTA